MEKSDINASAKRGGSGDMERQIAEASRRAILASLEEVQKMMVKDSDEWRDLEVMKDDITKETSGMVLYHKLKELEQVIAEESRQI